MVKDIFGNEHEAFKITSERYSRIVIIEDTDTHQACVVHKSDLNMPISEPSRSKSSDSFDLKATQELHYTQSDILEHAANAKYKGQT